MPDFDESFDPASEPQGPPAPQPPDPTEPWDQSSDIRLSKLNSALQAVNQQQESSYLAPYDAERLRSQIVPERTRLLQRKQASEQMQKQQAIRDAHEQAAVAQGVMLQNRQADADSLGSVVKPVVNPATGRTVLLAPKGYDVIDDGTNDAEESPGVPGGIDYMPPAASVMGIGATPDLEKTPDGHKLTIWNGLNRQEVQYDQNGQRTGIQNFGPDGSPVQPQAPQGPAETDLWKQARSKVGPEPPQFIAGPHGRPIPNPQHGHWATEVRQEHKQMWTDARDARIKQEKEDKEGREKKAKEDRDDYGKIHDDVYKRMQGKADEYDQPKGKDAQGNPLPPTPVEDRPEVYRDQAKMRAAVEEEAQYKFFQRHGHYHGDYKPGGQSAGAAPAGGVSKTPDQQPAPDGKAAPEPAVKGNTEADILAALEKKVQSDPQAAKQHAQAQADQTTAANVAALPPNANDETKFFAQLPSMSVKDIAQIYDAHRGLTATPHDVARDEAYISSRARATGTSVERYKANLVSHNRISPQSIERLKRHLHPWMNQ